MHDRSVTVWRFSSEVGGGSREENAPKDVKTSPILSGLDCGQMPQSPQSTIGAPGKTRNHARLLVN
jgi:hypothetical protein